MIIKYTDSPQPFSFVEMLIRNNSTIYPEVPIVSE